MGEFLLLLKDSANRVYTAAAAELSVAEMRLTCPFVVDGVVEVAGASYVSFHGELDETGVLDEPRKLGQPNIDSLRRLSAARGLFERVGDLLRPVPLPSPFMLDEDLVTIPKYAGKTNELFTRMLLNITVAQVWRDSPDINPTLNVLDPLAGRGTTLLTAWLTGHNAYGVESDIKSFEALASYMSTYLRTKRLKHACEVTPVRRDGKTLGKRLDVTLKNQLRTSEVNRTAEFYGAGLNDATNLVTAGSLSPSAVGLPQAIPMIPPLTMGVFTGDTRDSAALFGKKMRFDAVVTDAPYGVAHGAHSGAERTRSPEALLREAIPVWASQLRIGGAMGIAFNTHTLPRTTLTQIMGDAGLLVCEGEAWEHLAHRVDAAIIRDVVVATRAS